MCEEGLIDLGSSGSPLKKDWAMQPKKKKYLDMGSGI